MTIEKICVYGAGAVGGFLAGELAKAGRKVTVIARGPHLAAMKTGGLTVEAADGTYNVRPFCTDDPAEAGPQDLVITTLKAHSLPGAVDGIKALLGPDTPVCFAQNGIPWWYFHGLEGPHKDRQLETLDPGGRIWNGIGPERAIGTTINSPNAVPRPGVVHNSAKKKNFFFVGEPAGGDTARVAEISKALTTERVESPVAADIRLRVWNKLLRNIGSWPMGALTHTPVCITMQVPQLREITRQMMHEGKAVAQSLGVDPTTDIEEAIESFARAAPHKPSLLQDFEAGRPVEIDTVLKITQEFGRLGGVPTPMMDVMVALVEQKARTLGLYGR